MSSIKKHVSFSSKRILITGGSGMVGSALKRCLGATQISMVLLTPSREQMNLTDNLSVARFFAENEPELVLMAGAKVGGIEANRADPTGFLNENLKIQLNLFEACQRHQVEKIMFLGSSCIYPRDCSQPMKEDYLLTGPLEPTNEGYALAKLAGLKLAQYMFRQYGLKTVCPIPCNLYGTNDHFDLGRAHVLSALVKRFVDAVNDKSPEITLWGTGKARRELMHVDDAAEGMLFIMENFDDPEPVNLGTGEDVTISELAAMIAKESGFTGKILWDPSKPDGMPRKCLDIAKIREKGFSPRITLEEGIKRTIAEYRDNLNRRRGN